jgi:hypothetical protein
MCTYRTLGVKPLKKAEKPSFLMSSRMTVMPPTLLSKFWFWIRVLMTSSGCEIAIDETCELQNSGQPWRPAGNRAKRGDTYGSGDGSDKVLVPRCRSVVFKTEDVLLRERRTTKELCGDSLRCQYIDSLPLEVSFRRLTAKEPGAFRAAVQDAPR